MTATPVVALEACLALAPCPWCGAEMGPATVSEGSSFRWRKVDGCCTDGPEIRHNTMADDQAAAEVESTRKAIEAWNTRPALLAALRLPEWRPIESAPKSSSHILLFGDGAAIWQCVMVGNWRDDAWRLAFGGDAVRPTHWQPLPAPPSVMEQTK